MPAEGSGGAQAERDGILASLHATVGLLAPRLDSIEAKVDAGPQASIPWRAIHVVWVPGALSASGTVDYPDMWGPKDGYHRDVRRISAWGFTAGTITIYRNSASGEQLGVFTQTGSYTFSGNAFLGPRDRLIFVAASITGNVQIAMTAVVVESAWWPVYVA